MGMGDFYSTVFQADNCLIVSGSTPPPPAPMPGSLRFFDVSASLSTAGSSDWAVGTGDFTVEWYQYQTAITSSGGGNPYQRVFTVNVYPTASLAASIENGRLYAWIANGSTSNVQITLSNFLNQWVHFAFVRQSGTVNIYQNGTSISTFTNTTNVTDSTANLYVGADRARPNTIFQGFITDLHFVKGQALYTGPFTPPTGSIQPTSNTKLLLSVMSESEMLADSSGLNKTVTNGGAVAWNPGSPYHA